MVMSTSHSLIYYSIGKDRVLPNNTFIIWMSRITIIVDLSLDLLDY